jgi:hypothetical protein
VSAAGFVVTVVVIFFALGIGVGAVTVIALSALTRQRRSPRLPKPPDTGPPRWPGG